MYAESLSDDEVARTTKIGSNDETEERLKDVGVIPLEHLGDWRVVELSEGQVHLELNEPRWGKIAEASCKLHSPDVIDFRSHIH